MMNRMTGGRPLMTDHLQDLEMELQMLKRKRQMIQHQQQQNDMMNQRQNNYGRNHQFNQQYDDQSFTQDFSQFYTDFSEPTNYRENRPFVNKRPANVWQDQLPPKRFAGPPNSVNRQNNFHNQRPNNRNFQPGNGVGNRKNNGRRNEPMRPPRTHRPEPPRAPQNYNQGPRPRPANRSRPFVDNTPQYNRPQANLRTNFKAKAAAKPPNKLNSHPQAQRKALVANTVKEVESESNILVKDQPISKLVSGRLELALGQIMKQIKEKFEADEKYGPSFKMQHQQKMMKQAVRDRLRLALEDKAVDVVAEVVTAYRVMFPDETDRDIVELPLECEREKTKITKTFVDSEDPDDFYSINVKKLLCSKLDEMFLKLKTIYQKENTLKPGMTYNDTLNSTADQELNNTTVDEKVDSSAAQNGDEEKQANVENNKAKDEDIKNETEINVKDEKKVESTIEKKGISVDITEIEAKINELIPEILPKYKNTISKLLAHDRGFRYARCAAAFEASKRAAQYGHNGTEDAAISEDTDEKPILIPPHSNLFFVKIFGRPNLPKRPLMQAFLNKFQPKSIKKHKGVKNLLFVGFADQASQEKILAENKIVIGKCIITIKISETAKKDNGENADTSNANISLNDSKDASMKEETKVESTEELVTPDLGNQIDNLLSNIKKAEEEERGKNQSESKIETEKSVNLKDEIVKDDTVKTDNGDVEAEEAKDKVEIDQAVKSTPTRVSPRNAAATPSAVRTRRASKLALNN